MNLHELLHNKVLLLDGALGTMIQQLHLDEDAYRNEELADHPFSLKENFDLLSLTSPEVISSIHSRYLSAGADIITTNTFMANSLSMERYKIDHLLNDINRASVGLARKLVDEFNLKNPLKQRFVAGSVGPTHYVISDTFPIERRLDSSAFYSSYYNQIKVLVEEGIDLLLIETVVDLNVAAAALTAATEVMKNLQHDVPIVVSVTLSEDGKLLSGHSFDELLVMLRGFNVLSVGVNCVPGSMKISPFIKELVAKSDFYITFYPNAGLPQGNGEYRFSSTDVVDVVDHFLQKGWVNIVGGCCGTTDNYVALLAALVKNASPFIPHK